MWVFFDDIFVANYFSAMDNHSLLIFFAFFVVLITFSPRRPRYVPPITPITMLDGFCGTTRLLPVLAVFAWRQRFPRRMWWIEPRQYIHHDVVERDLWHTSPQMLDLRSWQTYRMTFLSFEKLVQELTPLLRPVAITFVRRPIPIRKQIKLVLYRLAHGVSCARMHNLYGYG